MQTSRISFPIFYLLFSFCFLLVTQAYAEPGFRDAVNKIAPDKEAEIVAGSYYRVQYPIQDGRYDVNRMFTATSTAMNAKSEKSRKFVFAADRDAKVVYMHWRLQPSFQYGYFQEMGQIFRIEVLQSDEEVLQKAVKLGLVKKDEAEKARASGFQQGASSPRFGGSTSKGKRSELIGPGQGGRAGGAGLAGSSSALHRRALIEHAMYRRQLMEDLEDLEDFGYL